MYRTVEQRLEDARAIWQAGVEAVLPQRLIPQHVHVDQQVLWIAGEPIDLKLVDRIAVVVTFTLLSTLPTLCSTEEATSAIPVMRAATISSS